MDILSERRAINAVVEALVRRLVAARLADLSDLEAQALAVANDETARKAVKAFIADCARPEL